MDTSVTILTYNTHLFKGTIPGWLKSLDDDERTTAIINAILTRSPDIVALCEVWADKRAEQIFQALASSYYWHYRPQKLNEIELSSGLLLISKLPITDVDFTAYSDLTGYDEYSEKGFITAQLAHSNSDELACRLIVTHNQATYDDNEVDKYAPYRENNTFQIFEKMNGFEKDEVPWIVTGDFNVIAEARGYPTNEYLNMQERFKDKGLVDMYREMNPEPGLDVNKWGLTYNGLTNPLIPEFDGEDAIMAEQRLDYFWVSESTKDTWEKCTVESYAYQYYHSESEIWPASDHYPIEATLKL